MTEIVFQKPKGSYFGCSFYELASVPVEATVTFQLNSAQLKYIADSIKPNMSFKAVFDRNARLSLNVVEGSKKYEPQCTLTVYQREPVWLRERAFNNGYPRIETNISRPLTLPFLADGLENLRRYVDKNVSSVNVADFL